MWLATFFASFLAFLGEIPYFDLGFLIKRYGGFTRDDIGQAVIDKDIEFGVTVRGIIEQENINGSEFATLAAASVDVRSHTGVANQLHHKYAIFDYAQGSAIPLLITGSHNWSASANSIHDENTLLIYDHTLANIYYQEFSARFQGFTDATSEQNVDPLKISPNPFSDQLNFKVSEKGNLIVNDLTGRILFQQKIIAGQNQLNTKNWMSGIYFVRFIGDNTQQIGKVLKK